MAATVLVPFLFVSIGIAFASLEQAIPPGHLKPFGSHADPIPLEETEDIPDAKTFFEKYVLPMRPIVFRNAAKRFDAFKLWSEDYLIKNYGDLEVRLENKLEKEGYTPTGAKGVGRDTIEEFIKTYKTAPKYIVSELPSPMYKDIMALPCMSCGPVKQRMVEIDMWMSSGSSQSILHKDAFHTMNCLINGTKDWKIVLYEHEKDLYKAYEDGDPGGGYSKINVRSVDMMKYPKIASLPYYNITVHGGDCLFLPKSTYHQVNSLPGFNLAITILFSRFDFDKPSNFKDCNATTEKFTPLSEFDIDWQYPGRGYMTMGYSELFGTKASLYRDAKRGRMKVNDVLNMFMLKKDPFTGETIDKHYVAKLFGVTPDETITKNHVKRLTKKQLRKIGVAMQGIMASNSYDYEYYKISPKDIGKLVAVLVKRDGILKRESFVDWYVKKLYGTKLYGDAFFNKISDENSQEVSKDLILKNFRDAAESYVGDDSIEEYDPKSRHEEKEDRGDAYIFVKKDLQGLEPDEELSKFLGKIVSEFQASGEDEGNDTSSEEEAEATRELADEEEEEPEEGTDEEPKEGAEEEPEEGAEEEPEEGTEEEEGEKESEEEEPETEMKTEEPLTVEDNDTEKKSSPKDEL